MRKYFDRNGQEIKAGMRIQIEGTPEPALVEPCGEDELGILATNKAFLKNHPQTEVEYYPLSNFDRRDLSIVEDAEEDDRLRDDDFLCERGDEIDNAVFNAICAMALPGTEVEWSMELIGEVNDFIESMLSDHKIPACYPYHEDNVICHKTAGRCDHCRK